MCAHEPTKRDDDYNHNPDHSRLEIESCLREHAQETYDVLRAKNLQQLGRVKFDLRYQDPDDPDLDGRMYVDINVHGVSPEEFEGLPGERHETDGHVWKTLTHGPRGDVRIKFFQAR